MTPSAPFVDPWQIHPVQIVEAVPESEGVTTYRLRYCGGGGKADYAFQPGQFNMLYVPGAGEMAISMSGEDRQAEGWLHTVRLAGMVTHAMSRLGVGGVLGMRGPFGKPWPLDNAQGCDVIVVAGGIGLAPLRPALQQLSAQRSAYGRLTLLYGARTPSGLLYRNDYATWQDAGWQVELTVDRHEPGWTGRVGVVPQLFDRLRGLNTGRTVVFICGPEVMILFAARAALARGIPPQQIWVSLERHMQCGVGMCGHCQLGPLLLCRDGPVVRYDHAERWLQVEGL
jgi:NAD(P)H-flavin reductase